MEIAYSISLPNQMLIGTGAVEKVGERAKELGKVGALIITVLYKMVVEVREGVES